MNRFTGLRHSTAELTSSWKRTILVLLGTVVLWIGFTLLYYPTYSYQLLTADITYLGAALSSLVWYQYTTTGVLGTVLPPVISLLTAALFALVILSFQAQYNTRGSVSGAAAGMLGFATAGCASCGVGLLALLGFGAGATIFPFQGLGVQLVSAVILVGVLEYMGRQPQVCSTPEHLNTA